MSDRSIHDVLKELDILLSEVILLQQTHVSEVCPCCKDICCRKVQFLFDEKDMIYQKLSGREPPRRRKAMNTKGCSFLTARGCSLHPNARPFTCHRFICPALRAAMARHDPELPTFLEKQFVTIDNLRSDLWRSYPGDTDSLAARQY